MKRACKSAAAEAGGGHCIFRAGAPLAVLSACRRYGLNVSQDEAERDGKRNFWKSTIESRHRFAATEASTGMTVRVEVPGPIPIGGRWQSKEATCAFRALVPLTAAIHQIIASAPTRDLT
ncbi:hypothetical protein BD311DRAFT_772285 [Dichomitus squalens]|uniref:Uncharacterized protein n=1 Tax=Dichomitus squalens TaxID=114155 RepID=A0A4Q9M4Y1_9APHY|nr:hypothetical protein BD311DRAFT_772285 [Dichomitus squalens]